MKWHMLRAEKMRINNSREQSWIQTRGQMKCNLIVFQISHINTTHCCILRLNYLAGKNQGNIATNYRMSYPFCHCLIPSCTSVSCLFCKLVNSPPLKWIIVLVYSKPVNSQRQNMNFIWSKLGWGLIKPVDISRAWVTNQSAADSLVWYITRSHLH